MRLPNKDRLLTLLFASPFYNVSLGRRTPKTIQAPPPCRGLAAQAACFADGVRPSDGLPDNERDGDFRWLSDAALWPQAWPAIATWRRAHSGWAAATWRADVLGERMVRWISAFDGVGRALEPAERSAWAADILRGAKHLTRAPVTGIAPWRRLFVHQGRILAALALDEQSARLAEHLEALGADVDRQVLNDGGHVERAPAKALAVLAILCEIRDALLARHIEPPTGLISAIDRSVPFIKALQMGDGGFSLIGGATADTAPLITAVLDASGSKGRAMTSAPHAGFHRLRAGQTTVILDCGETLIPGTPSRAPASFEFGVGKVRIVGNCGARLGAGGAGDPWRRALATTAAHTALVINDKDAGAVSFTRVERREHEGARLVEAEHNGYAAAFGIHHRRTLYLDAGGSDLRGEDVLRGGGSQPFSVRFHLYPEVRASMVAGGGEIIVKPPKGRGWRFQCRYPVRLEESVSFMDGRQHRTQQIVILGNHEPTETTVKWRFAMEG